MERNMGYRRVVRARRELAEAEASLPASDCSACERYRQKAIASAEKTGDLLSENRKLIKELRDWLEWWEGYSDARGSLYKSSKKLLKQNPPDQSRKASTESTSSANVGGNSR